MFKQIVDEWVAEGIVGEWEGTFGMLDSGSGKFTQEPHRQRFVGTPSMNSVAKALAKRDGVALCTSRRVVRFEGGPSGCDKNNRWSVVHRSSGPAIMRKDGTPIKVDQITDENFHAVVVADKQAASDRSTRAYQEQPPMQSAASPVVWHGMRAASQTPSFALMFAVRRKFGGDTLFPFHGATVVGDDVVSWIADDSSKPGRPTGSDTSPGAVQCFVATSTSAYAKSRAKALVTVPGTAPHQSLLDEVAKEMLEATLRLAGVTPKDVDVVHVAAHRWGAAFPGSETFAAAAESGGGCLSDFPRRIVGCGDFCVSPKMEGAVLSGAAAAARVTEMLADAPFASL